MTWLRREQTTVLGGFSELVEDKSMCLICMKEGNVEKIDKITLCADCYINVSKGIKEYEENIKKDPNYYKRDDGYPRGFT